MSLSASVEIVFGLDRVSVEIEFRGGGDMYTTFQNLGVSKMH